MWIYFILLVTLPPLDAASTRHKLVKKQFVDGDSNDAFQFPDQTGDVETNSYQAGNYISSFMDPGGGGGGVGGGAEGGSEMNDENADFGGLSSNPLEDNNGGSRQMLESPLNEGGGNNDLSSLSSLLTQDTNNEESPSSSLTADTSTNPSSILSSFNNNLNGGDDLLSSLTDDPFGKKVESSVNLGDTSATTTTDLSALDAFKGNSPFDKLLSSGYSVGLPPENGQNIGQATTAIETNKHKTGDSKEGIGNKLEDVQDLLSKELTQLDSADQKLENMLENGIDSDSNSGSTNIDPYMMPNNQDSMMNVGTATNNWGGMDGSYYNNGMQTPMNNQYNTDAAANNMVGGDQQQPLQQANVNQGNTQQEISPTVVKVHASDKQTGTHPGNDHLSVVAAQKAANKQQQQKETHAQRLKKLRDRLKLLNQKLEEFQREEQAKKSSYSGDGMDPRKQRNKAIKRLLIKNLKLAALIATKEIQIEEARSRTLPYSSERKEDYLNATDPPSSDKDNGISNDHDFLNNSKPLTELSRKAEEEVNHLTKNELNNAKQELLKLQNKTAATNVTKATVNVAMPLNKTTPLNDVVKINETLEILDRSGNNIKNETFNSLLPLKQSLSNLNKTTINSTATNSLPVTNATISLNNTNSSSTVETVAVGDSGMASLFTAMKEKAAANTAKRRSTLHKRMKTSARKQNLKFERSKDKN